MQLTAEHQAHVVLMDLRMPVMDGLNVIEQLGQLHPQVAVIILTTYNEDEMMLRGLKLGRVAIYGYHDGRPATCWKQVPCSHA